jgi:D-alanyl-D-alanine carboxypeptidase/D-alanyl-D-alanine-endopeptidase (penicillin-binding protein 4)
LDGQYYPASGQQRGMIKIGLFLALCLTAFSAQAELPTEVAAALKKAGIPLQSVAVYVQAVDASVPTISHNADKSMNPASVMKLVTTYAALDLLTPTYRWKTDVFRDGSLSNGVLNGNLIIKGSGDPSFKAQEFWRLLMTLQQAGVQNINGNLIIDKSLFAQRVGPRKTVDDETWRAYNAEPSAFLVGGRNTSFRFIATETGVNVSPEFALTEVQVINQMRREEGACGDWRSRFGYTVKSDTSGAVVIFTGIFSPDCGERYLELSVLSDEQYAFYTFKKLWRELGGQFNGELKVQEVPVGAVKLLEQLSDPLGYVICDINKWSNNLMARQLLLTLGVEKQGVEKIGTPATEAKGATAVTKWLAGKSLQFAELNIENGSGLSRIERISAGHLGQLLVSAYNSPIMPELMASLPILALDGTVQKRLKDTPAQGRAHLKTGSLDGVSSIAGYVMDHNNKRHVMVMLVNHPKSALSKSAQDALITYLVEN